MVAYPSFIWFSYEKPSSSYCAMQYFLWGCRGIWNRSLLGVKGLNTPMKCAHSPLCILSVRNVHCTGSGNPLYKLLVRVRKRFFLGRGRWGKRQRNAICGPLVPDHLPSFFLLAHQLEPALEQSVIIQHGCHPPEFDFLLVSRKAAETNAVPCMKFEVLVYLLFCVLFSTLWSNHTEILNICCTGSCRPQSGLPGTYHKRSCIEGRTPTLVTWTTRYWAHDLFAWRKLPAHCENNLCLIIWHSISMQ